MSVISFGGLGSLCAYCGASTQAFCVDEPLDFDLEDVGCQWCVGSVVPKAHPRGGLAPVCQLLTGQVCLELGFEGSVGDTPC